MSQVRRRFARVPAWAVATLFLAGGCEERTTYQHAPFAHDPAPVGSLRGRVVVTNSLEDALSVAGPEAPGPVQRLPGIQVPTLILWGGRDRLIPPVWGEKFHAAIPGSRLVKFPALGHVPQEEDPAATLAALRDWLPTVAR